MYRINVGILVAKIEFYTGNMPKQSATVENSTTKQVTKSQPTVEPLCGLMVLVGDASIQRQATCMGDSRFGLVQRQALAMHISQTARNQHLQRVIKSLPLSPVQRDTQQNTAGDEKARSVTVDGVVVRSYEEATSWLLARINHLRLQKFDFTDSVAQPGSHVDAIESGADLYAVFSTMSGQMSDIDLIDLQAWCQEFIAASNEAESIMSEEVASKMEDAKEESIALEAGVQDLVVPIRDKQRDSFRQDDENKLLAAANAIAGILDCSLAAKDSIEEINKALSSLKPYRIHVGTLKLLPPAKSKLPAILSALEKVNKVYASFQIVHDSCDVLSGGGKTQAHNVLSGIKLATTIASAGGTLLGCSAAFSLYANIYLGPAVDACINLIGKIQDHRSRDWNRTHIQMGEFDLVDWSLEPGGRAMFDFMLTVMHADDSGGVPMPVPKSVEEYLLKQEDVLNKGVGYDKKKHAKGKERRWTGEEGSALPTDGDWFWTDIDAKYIQQWVFNNRQNLWAMFYGNCEVPAR